MLPREAGGRLCYLERRGGGGLPQADDVLSLNWWARESRDGGRTLTALPLLLNGCERCRGQEHTHGREEEEGILETDGCKF